MNNLNIKSILLIIFITTTLLSCKDDVGGNEDKTSPKIELTSLNSGEEVIGTFSITWATDDPNPSTVDIYLSTDSGATYPTLVELNVPDTGSYSWDTNSADDCRNCRLGIIPQDIVGNVGEPAESAEDFIINNVPQVLGVAYYYDLDNNGFDGGDEIRVPFDKEIEIRTSIASDIFFFPVLGDSIGPFSTVKKGDNPKELIITMDILSPDSDYRLHIRGEFKQDKLGRTFPSGINLQDNISEGIIFATDTGRTAAVAELGIDILPTFSDSEQAIGFYWTTSIALGDVDGDGDLDMVEGNYSDANRVFLNGGDNTGSNTGLFRETRALGSSNTRSIALGDVDGDGDLDIVAGNGDANRIWLNDGTGEFIVSEPALGSSNTTSIALGDVDGDGDLDIVAGNTVRSEGDDGSNRVWLNGGDDSGSNTGIFIDSGQALGSSNTRSIALGDVDGDGDMDIVIGNEGANRVWLNNINNTQDQKGVFTNSGQVMGSDNTKSITLGDVDGDGDLDMVTGNDTLGTNRVWLNNINNTQDQKGVFTDSGQVMGRNDTTSIALGDVDGDGDLDIVTGNSVAPPGRDANRVWLNGGDSSGSNTGVFTDSGQAMGRSGTTSIALGDVDGDGDLDIVTGYYADNNRVQLNSLRLPSAAFMLDFGQTLGNSDTKSIALGDIDGDDDLDIVVGNNNGANRVWLNGSDSNGINTGVFTDSGQAMGSSDTTSIALGDVDGDGDLDMVAGNSDADTVWLNGGDNSGSNTGMFTDSNQTLGNSYTTSIALGDVDGDGDLDIVTGNNGANRVWLNNIDNTQGQEGVFTNSDQALGNGWTNSIALGDVDGDGDLDMVAGNSTVNYGSGANRVWLNNIDNTQGQEGVFTDSDQVMGSDNTKSIALGDVDGDGDLDMVTGNDTLGTNRVWLNNINNTPDQKGVFTDSGQVMGRNDTTSIALGDVDGDEDLDMVVGSTGRNSVWLNNSDSSSNTTRIFTDYGQAIANNIYSRSVALGDIDGDGDLDMVAGYSSAIRIWLNDF